jgi:hypothetical protein
MYNLHTRTNLELKTRFRFCPVNLSLSITDIFTHENFNWLTREFVIIRAFLEKKTGTTEFSKNFIFLKNRWKENDRGRGQPNILVLHFTPLCVCVCVRERERVRVCVCV